MATVRPDARAETTARSAAVTIVCGRLCSTAGSGVTAAGQPRRPTISRTCPASAPQATISKGGERKLLDETVVEVGAVRELDIPHLLQQRQAAGPLPQAEQRPLRPLAPPLSHFT